MDKNKIKKIKKIEQKVGMGLPTAQTRGVGILCYEIRVYPPPTDSIHGKHRSRVTIMCNYV